MALLLQKGRFFHFLVTLMLLLAGTSCQKKAQVLNEARELGTVLAERNFEMRKLDTDIAALGDLGRYNDPKAAQFAELKQLIEIVKSETARLKVSRDEHKLKAEALQKDFEAYQAKYGSN